MALPNPILDETTTVGLLPGAAYKKIEDTLQNKSTVPTLREYDLEVYCKMMLNAVRMAEAQLSQVNRRANMYRKMFTIWQPHVKHLRRKKEKE